MDSKKTYINRKVIWQAVIYFYTDGLLVSEYGDLWAKHISNASKQLN